jgi:hypothetical protein
MSLNVGCETRKEVITADERAAIDNFLKQKGVTQLPPAGLTGNEAVRATNELIARKRREFRAKQRGK